MVKPSGSKLLNALQKEKGFDYKQEKQKRMRKEAEKKKKTKKQPEQDDEDDSSEDIEAGGVGVTGAAKEGKTSEAKVAKKNEQSESEEESDDEEDASNVDLSRLENSDSDSSGDELEEIDDDEDDEDDEDVPLSDLESVASDEKGDIIPHQKLTINNTTALMAAVKRIEMKTSKLSFSEHQSITSAEPIEVEDTNDDLNRELAFYKQALAAAKEARGLLKKEGVPFSRPNDFFAEMVKSDEHMGKIKQKLVDEAASKQASTEARKQRDLKKFGKAVQVAKQQERDKAKRETLEKINVLKRKRQGADLENENENDMFDVALEDAAETEKKDKAARRANGVANTKRAKKDAKFGFGGKKRFAKSNDAQSSTDMRGFSVKKMKGQGAAAKKRPGKARRHAGK
ncbi:eukaryotic rRNA processing protein EBP2-containing protein [Phyllosticta citribraziliensis]|uniref:Eukaryotic rRNA processing protein EBP2-containing protein n=1 Tax=Phyllosticta citribraziliensis TaxID=989973 RepID=A0ABR1L4G5_9PEZI